jgi:DNA-nicking Smr family endonuclease
MTNTDTRPRGRKRVLTGEERALWRHVTQSITPLKTSAPQPEAAGTEPQQPVATGSPAGSPGVAPTAKPPGPPAALPLADIERKLRKKVARGAQPIDARLDLHGYTQDRAHSALLRFLGRAQASGYKLVLVITGKGARTGGDEMFGPERGVLRRLVPQWLGLPECRAYVVGFESAGAAHGGEGALYVRIRRAR